MMKIKRICAAFVFLVLVICGGNLHTFGASGEENRVFDKAGLFSDDEKETLEEQIQTMKSNMKMDVVILTTDDAGGKSTKDYAESFYIDGEYGMGDDYRGALFLIDMDNRQIYILPVGKMNRYLTDKRWNAILDDAYPYVKNQEYGQCAQAFLDGVMKYYKAGIPNEQYNYDEDTGKISVYRSIRPYEALLAVLVAIFAAAAACGSVVLRYSMKWERGRANNSLMAYQADCNLLISNQEDTFVRKHVTSVKRQKNNGGGGGGSGNRSTTHSSSGRTMGGGGRGF